MFFVGVIFWPRGLISARDLSIAIQAAENNETRIEKERRKILLSEKRLKYDGQKRIHRKREAKKYDKNERHLQDSNLRIRRYEISRYGRNHIRVSRLSPLGQSVQFLKIRITLSLMTEISGQHKIRFLSRYPISSDLCAL